jgi:predicted AAA+ superfamily ATPase
MILRIIEKQIIDRLLTTNKSVILYGPRQIGKTTLAKSIIKQVGLKTLVINADEKKYDEILSSQDLAKIDRLIAGYQLVFIDEAQRIENIGINLKIIIDSHPEMRILATGSSSFDLSNKISEPLTGRVWTYNLFPISCEELLATTSEFEYHQNLENYLLYGSYPEVFSYPKTSDQIDYLKQISTSYLYKDILEFAEIKYADKISKLLKLVALQLGNEVSLSELGNALDISKETVNRYLDLLEKSFVLFRLSGFSRNLRKEVTKMDKIYFYDLGIRNSLLGNFNAITYRSDLGSMWENFLLLERMKRNHYHRHFASPYFWRTHTGSEVDYVEDFGGVLYGFEFKWNQGKSRSKESWLKTYPDASYTVINQENFFDFIRNKP